MVDQKTLDCEIAQPILEQFISGITTFDKLTLGDFFYAFDAVWIKADDTYGRDLRPNGNGCCNFHNKADNKEYDVVKLDMIQLSRLILNHIRE